MTTSYAAILPASVSAHAKLTLSLRVVGVRGDGYHLIDAEMLSLDLADRLELVEGRGLSVEGGGREVPVGSENLVCRAMRLAGCEARVRLQKRIPTGAGLGGGSADAAAILRWAGFADLVRASELGADVPFCLIGGRARVGGIGEQVEPLPFEPFEGKTYTLLCPPLHVSTAAVYAAWDAMGGPRGEHGNDLEPAAMSVVPELARWRDALGEATGRAPRLAGSGGTWFVEGSFPGDSRLVVKASRLSPPQPLRGVPSGPPGAASAWP